jgi:glycosyltransferase involved in cell wall biosynthesis
MAGTGARQADVAFVGRLDAQKGVDRLLTTLLHCSSRLLVVGDGPQKDSLESLAGSLGVADRVTFTGRLSVAEVAAVYASVGALVFAPRELDREGLPTVVLEALAHELPVITIPGEIWPDDILDQLTFVEDPEDPAALAAAFETADLLPPSALPARYQLAHTAVAYKSLFEDISG